MRSQTKKHKKTWAFEPDDEVHHGINHAQRDFTHEVSDDCQKHKGKMAKREDKTNSS